MQYRTWFWTKVYNRYYLQLFAMISKYFKYGNSGYPFQVWRAETSPDLGGPSPEAFPAIMEKMMRENPVREALRWLSWLLGLWKFWSHNFLDISLKLIQIVDVQLSWEESSPLSDGKILGGGRYNQSAQFAIPNQQDEHLLCLKVSFAVLPARLLLGSLQALMKVELEHAIIHIISDTSTLRHLPLGACPLKQDCWRDQKDANVPTCSRLHPSSQASPSQLHSYPCCYSFSSTP